MVLLRTRGVLFKEWASLTYEADPIIIAWILEGLGINLCSNNDLWILLISALRWLITTFMSCGLHLSQIWKSSTKSRCDFLHLTSAEKIGMIRILKRRPAGEEPCGTSEEKLLKDDGLQSISNTAWERLER